MHSETCVLRIGLVQYHPSGKVTTFMACVRRVLFLGAVLWLSGCATTSSGDSSSLLTKIAEAVGLQKPEAPEIPEMQKPPRKIALAMHAGQNLNAGAGDKALSAIVRVYKLKQTSAFYSAPYDTFLSPDKERAVLGVDLIEVREFNLVPGQVYEATETLSREAGYIGVVTLFMAPAPQRWRAAFTAAEAEASGVRLGVHACSITLGKGAATDQAKMSAITNTPSRCN